MKKEQYHALGRKLTEEERNELFEEYTESKDIEIRDILIEEYLYIAEILARKYEKRGIDYDDLFQVASLGLMYAINRFDISKGYKFSSFATPTIIGEIKKYFRDKGWTIRVPRRIQELYKKINNVKNKLSQKYQRQPTINEIAKELNSTPEEIVEAMEAGKVYSPQSLDKIFESDTDEKEVNFGDLIGEKEKNFEKIDLNDFIKKTLNELEFIEKKILIDRYFNKKTQVMIAKELKISQMTVSRIEKKVLKKLRKEI